MRGISQQPYSIDYSYCVGSSAKRRSVTIESVSDDSSPHEDEKVIDLSGGIQPMTDVVNGRSCLKRKWARSRIIREIPSVTRVGVASVVWNEWPLRVWSQVEHEIDHVTYLLGSSHSTLCSLLGRALHNQADGDRPVREWPSLAPVLDLLRFVFQPWQEPHTKLAYPEQSRRGLHVAF